MKIKNIAFSGFMAAIMLSTGAAMAVPQIASKAYVDNKSADAATAAVKAALENENGAIKTALDAKADASTVTEVKTTAETAQAAATAAKATADANKNAIENEQTGLAATKKVADAAAAAAAAADTKAGSAQTAAAAAQATANAAATKTEVTSSLALKEDTSNKTGSITTENQSSASLFPTIGAVTEWTNNKIAGLKDTGLPVNPNNIADGTIVGSKLSNGAVSTEKIADGAVTADKLSSELKTKVNNAQTSEQVSAAIVDAIKDKANKATTLEGYGITDAMTETEVKAYAIPKPEGTCENSVNRCVLSVDTTNGQTKMVWMDVTSPLGDETSGN